MDTENGRLLTVGLGGDGAGETNGGKDGTVVTE